VERPLGQDQIMPTTAGAPRPRTKRASRVEIGVVALSTLVAVGVSFLFLALIGAGRIPSAPRHHSSHPPSLSQYSGSGAPRTAIQIHTTPAHKALSSRSWAGNPEQVRRKDEF
jgi:hypothetical protein